jgi:hypothetical protein
MNEVDRRRLLFHKGVVVPISFNGLKLKAKLPLALIPGVLLTQAAHSQVTNKVQMTDAAIHSSVTAPGINLGTINYYNDGQILKNMAGYINPGFEPALTQQIMVVAKNGSTNSWTDPNSWNSPSKDEWAGAAFTVTHSQSGANTGCTGKIAANTGPNAAYASAFSISNNVVTITAPNDFVAGETVYVYGSFKAGSYLNYKVLTVLPTGLSGTQFEAVFAHANVGKTTDFNRIQAESGTRAPVYTTENSCPAAFSAGDTIVLKLAETSTPESMLENSFGGFWPQLSGAATIKPDTTDLCSTCGKQALDLNGTSGSATVVEFWDTSPAVNLFRLLNGSYTISYWAKVKSGSASSLKVQAFRSGTHTFNSGVFTPKLTSTWTEYKHTFTAAELGIGSGNSECSASGSKTGCTVQTPGSSASLSFKVAGGEVYLDNVSIAPTTSSNPTIFTDNFVETLTKLHPGFLRYWLGQNAETAENWLAPDTERSPTGPGFHIGPSGGTQFYPSLDDFLVLAKTVGTTPYVEIPVTISDADAACIVQFLADASGGCADKRIALKQTTPWVGASGSPFSKVYLSFCNECWNGSFAEQNLPYRAGSPNDSKGHAQYYYDYQNRAAQVISAMRADPSYSPLIRLGVGAQTAVSYTGDDLLATAHPDYIELEGYWYNYVSAYATDAQLWTPAWVDAYTHQLPGDAANFHGSIADYQAQKVCGPKHNAACEVTLYEWAQSVYGGTISQAAQNVADAGAGTAVSTALEALLNMRTYGLTAQNYFAINEFSNGGLNKNTAKLWGMAIDFDGATHNMRPQYYALQMVNEAAKGSMYTCSVSGTGSTTNFAGTVANATTLTSAGVALTPAVASVPLVYSFCFGSSTQRTVVLINTDLAAHNVTVGGAHAPTGAVTITTLGGSPDLMNETSNGTSTQSTGAKVLPVTKTVTNPGTLTLPKASVTTLSYAVK